MEKLLSQWLNELKDSLVRKYKNKFDSDIFLSIWCGWWQEDVTDANKFLNGIGATQNEIKAYLYVQGAEEYKDDLLEEYKAII